MKRWLVDLLLCPQCRTTTPLIIASETEDGDIMRGTLRCADCRAAYPVRNGIPRFVPDSDNYSENFGTQWQAFRTTQIDRLAHHRLSEARFFKDTKWATGWLNGKLILDAGCGAGRFADVMAQHGARVVACDMSSAVDACRAVARDPRGQSSNRGEIEVVQGNLMDLPFRPGSFDAVHCAGVIQHTPDPQQVMADLPTLVRDGGRIFYNFYEIDAGTRFQIVKYALRRTTWRWPAARLHGFCRVLCWIFFVPSLVMSRIPKIRFFNRFLPICSVHPPGIPVRQQFEMTLLDTIDWYGPRYEIRQDHRRVAKLLRRLGLANVEVAPGLAWALKPDAGELGTRQ